MGGGGDNWSYKTVKMSPTNQHPAFTGRMPFLLPNQQCQNTEGNQKPKIVEVIIALPDLN